MKKTSTRILAMTLSAVMLLATTACSSITPNEGSTNTAIGGTDASTAPAKVNNPYFSQWIDALVLAQEDRSLKYVTVTVVDSIHNIIWISFFLQ